MPSPKKGQKRKKKKNTVAPVPPEVQKNDELDPVKTKSMTAVTDEALRTGIVPSRTHEVLEIPGEDRKLKGGDPDVDPLQNEYSGEEFPGAATPTPDQSNVDDIGRAYGLAEEDSGELRTADEILQRRDRKRQELEAPKKPGEL